MPQTWADFPGFNWGLMAQAPTPISEADPTKGTYAKNADGSFQYFEPGQNPKAYLGDSIPGGSAWAVPGTDEANHLERLMKTGTNQAAIKIATLVGGGAALGSALPSFSGTGAAEALQPVSVGASYLPGGTIGFEGAGAAGAGGAANVAGLPALSGTAEAFPSVGSSLAASGDFGGGEYGANALFGDDPSMGSGGGFFSKLGDYFKGGNSSPGFSQLANSGQQQQQPNPMLNMMMAALVNRKPYVPAYELGREVYPMANPYGR